MNCTFRELFNLLRVMKIVILFMLIGLTHLSAEVRSQNASVSLKLKDATIEQVILEVEKQLKQDFFFSKKEVDVTKKISVNLNQATLDELVRVIFGESFGYRLVDNLIVITPRAVVAKEEEKTILMKGQVVDKGGAPLLGVTVLIEGTTVGCATDIDGKFSLPLPKELKDVVVVFRFVGMETQKVKLVDIKDKEILAGKKDLKVVMEELSENLEDVVVTGIFTRKKESFTGSVASYSKNDLKKVGTSNVLQSLKTLDPSFAILDDVQFGSDPNRLPNMEIRGKSSILGMRDNLGVDPNQPLFILDGFESSLEAINDLDINRIESITILKDAASTAIYGSKAANGVVVVETVKPVTGELQVSYNGNLNLSVPDLSSYNLMNAREKLEFELLAGRYDPSIVETPYVTNIEMELAQMYQDRLRSVAEGIDTYWLAEPLRVGVNQKHSLYVMGGEGNFMFGLGGAYNGITGVMKESKRQVLSGNIDLIYRISKFQFSNKFSINKVDYDNPVVSFSEYARSNPYYKKRNGNGIIEPWLEYNDQAKLANPLWNANLNSRDLGKNLSLTNYFIAEWNPNSMWKLRGRFGLTYNSDKTENFISPENTNQILNKENSKRGEYKTTNTCGTQYEGEFTVTFARLLGKHRMNLVGGGNVFSSESLLEGYSVEGFPAGDFTYPSFAGGYPENSLPTYLETISHSVNAYFNAGYSFDDRYLMDFSLRLNGSSVFGSTNKYNTTWSLGLGWNLHREKFIADHLLFINLFKIRASIGNPGNQSFDSGRTLITYALQSCMLNYFGLGALPDQIGNPDLKWQITRDKNIGVDLSLFNSRFSLTVDYFHKVTDPLLIGITMPYSSGTTDYFTNAGEQISQGVTFSIIGHILRDTERRILWSVRLNGRTQKTKIDGIGDKLDVFNNDGRGSHTQRYYDGADPDDIWVIKSAGIDPSTGKELFFTKEGGFTYDFSYDNEIICGNTRPDIEGVFGTSFTYKGLSLSLNFRYQLGADVFNSAVLEKVENVDLYYNQDRRALHERWHNPGDVRRFKNIRDVNPSPMSSRFVQRENVLALESLYLEYEFMDGWIRQIGLGNLKLFFSMRDVFRASTIRSERGIDYPFARSMDAGLSFNF